jgi:hypothetical protein
MSDLQTVAITLHETGLVLHGATTYMLTLHGCCNNNLIALFKFSSCNQPYQQMK